MSSQRPPWSRSPGRAAPVARFGSLDPAVIRAGTGKGPSAPPDPGSRGEPAGRIGTGADSDPTVSANLLGSAVSAVPGHPGGSPATLPAVPAATPHPAYAEPDSPGFPAGEHPEPQGAAGVDIEPAAGYSDADLALATRFDGPSEESLAAGAADPDRYPGDPFGEDPPVRALSRPGPSGRYALLGLCLGLAVLLAAGGFYLGRTTGPDQAGTPGLATVASAPTATVEVVPPPSKTSVPGAGSRDVGTGFVFGKVRSNDGETLTVKSEITPTEITVHTDRDTKLYVLMASRVEGITIGAPVMVYGRRHADGSLTANTITGLSLQA
ncbi:DUF5666 domain-containing protein [Nocardia sp. NPDC003345]